MGYWLYYLAPFIIGYFFQYPPLIAIVVVFFLFRRWIPDPLVFFKTLGRIRQLEAQVAANPSNITARRDLGWVLIERKRPKRAAVLLEEALQESSRRGVARDAELLFLLGLALHRMGRDNEALPHLVEAVGIDSRVRFGEAYLVAGDALTALSRNEEALDAYERYTDANSSSIRGLLKLSLAQSRTKDSAAASKTLSNAIETYRTLPSYVRKREFWWMLRARVTQLWI